jgi:MraZ protein
VGKSGRKWRKVSIYVLLLLCLISVYLKSTAVAGYTGQFECKVDAKGRMKLPAGLLRQVAEEAKEHYVINKGLDDCLMLYTQADWEKLTAKLNQQLNYFNESHRKFQRIFLNMAVMVDMDSSERVLIPKRLADAAGIKDEVVIMAVGNNIELWSKEKYDANFSEMPQNLSDLAGEVLGNINLFG